MPVIKHTEVIDTLCFNGTGALTATIKNTAAEDLGNGRVRFQTAAAHGFLATEAVPIQMEIEGTTNYEGVRQVVNISEADKFDIIAPYVAETPAGTETIKFNIFPAQPYAFRGIELEMDTAPTTAGDLTIDVDNVKGATWDHNYRTKGMVGITDWDWMVKRDERKTRKLGTRMRIAYANADGRALSIIVEYEILS